MNSATIALAIIILLIVVLAVFIYSETNWIEINHYEVPLGKDRLKKSLTLVHLSDVHISSWALPSSVSPIFDYVNSLEPDYVILTGDYVTLYRELIPGTSAVLGRIKAKEGVLAVPGNHEYWTDAPYIIRAMEEEGIKFLINRAIRTGSNPSVSFVGVDDVFTNRDDLELALEHPQKNGLTILLSHSPDIIKKAANNKIDLVLSGHTHGGQVRLPFWGALYVPSKYGKKYDMGWFMENGTRMYVNRGLGGVFPPVRFFCRREVAVLKLTAGEGEPTLVEKKSIRFKSSGGSQCKT